ncbi:hypothetical protein CG747_36880 [Streptomyces sp. CB02959]|uniref:hypothetical protein n=1 Tax=Streptomyces sp. CB02959 TaxID=2020330 RepID=UPI000C278E73|nr:hypothetical protein [Streptomyces sp. CB02959]PJN35740.1 hypothetical protein CG747_36880 [Streptomyces sp. CB02959]
MVRSADHVLFASVHASAGNRNGGGRDADGPPLVRRFAAAAATRRIARWVALGDFNRDPGEQNGRLPAGTRIYNSEQATQRSEGELDYMFSNVDTQTWQATVEANRGSDHWPYFGSLQAGAGPRDLTVTSGLSGLNLDVFHESLGDGTHVIQYHTTGATNRLWAWSGTASESAGARCTA